MGGKKKQRGRRDPQPVPTDAELVGLLASAREAVEHAIGAVGVDPPAPGPRVPSVRPRDRLDPLLIDRYEGLLVRSGIVAGTVQHLPSRLHERAEGVLRELIIGVARDRPVTVARLDALIGTLLTQVGEQIACQVADWCDTADRR